MSAHRDPSTERGFSMIEIIVALVIVGILMAVVMPTFLNQKRDGVNKSTIAAAQTFQQAASEYLRSFPPVGGPDPLLSRGGYSGPFTRELPPTTGLYGAAGDPLVKNWPTNPFTKKPVNVLRGPCTTTGGLGEVLLCRPTSPTGTPDLELVRAIAWGRSKAGTAVVVYDSQTCQGPCPVS